MREIDRSLYSVAVVERTTRLLDALMRHGPNTLAELAKHAECTRTAAFRLLRTMEANGQATQDGPRGKWRLGAYWVAMGAAATAQRAQELACLPLMRALAEETGENVCLHRRDGMDALTLAIAHAKVQIRVYVDVGDRRGLHASHGRLLLAFAPLRIQRQLSSQKLQRYTPNTLVDPSQVLADAARVRQRGWLISVGELEEGEVTVTTPVRDAAGTVLALAIAAPALRVNPARARGLVPRLESCASRISQLLGHVPAAEIEGGGI